MAITEPYFLYSGESFFAGLNVLCYVSTLFTAGPTAVERMSRFFTAFALISVGRLLLITLHTHSGAVGLPSAGYAVPEALLDCACSVGFLVAKHAWIKQCCGEAMIAASKKVGVGMTGLVGISNGLAISNCLWQVVVGTATGTYLDHTTSSSAYALYSVSLIVNSLVHAILSAVVVYTLLHSQANTSASAPSRKATKAGRGDYHFAALLAFEVTLVILTHWSRALAPAFDPQNSSVLLADAIRLRIYCLLCEKLSPRMSKSTSMSQAGDSTASDHKGAGSSTNSAVSK